MTRDNVGLLEALVGFGANLIGIVQNRIELAGIELVEARTRLIMIVAAGLAAALFLCAAVILLTAWIAALLWPALGAAALGWLTLVYVAIAVGLLLWARGKIRNDPPLLGETRAELRADAAFMRGRSLPRELVDRP